MCTQIINSTGLIIGIIGTFLVFKWGISFQKESYGIGLENGNEVDTKWGKMKVGDARLRGEREEQRARILSKLGIILIGIGFAFQLLAVWIPNNK